MTSSGSRPPESSQTSHRFTRCRVTSKFGFARLMPDRSSRNTRAALYRGPPIASQYSWNDARDGGDADGQMLEDPQGDQRVGLDREDRNREDSLLRGARLRGPQPLLLPFELRPRVRRIERSEERRVGKECTV